MEFVMPDNKETVHNVAKKIGYRYFDLQDEKEYNLVKDLSGGRRYPRFHLYIKKDEENDRLTFNLHLDQKYSSYEKSGTHKHSGEHNSEVVKKELERIKNILKVPSEGRTYKF